MTIPPFLIRVLSDLVAKEDRDSIAPNIRHAAEQATLTAETIVIVSEQIQDLQTEVRRLQAMLTQPHGTEGQTIESDEPEQPELEFTEPDFSDHPKAVEAMQAEQDAT